MAPGGGQHTQCRGKVAGAAAIYHFKLCRAILMGFKNQMRRGGVCREGFVGTLNAGLEKQSMALAPMFRMTYRDHVFHANIEGARVQ